MRKSVTTTKGLRALFTAALAATIAVAMSFMAFDANTLRAAFADEGAVEAIADQAEDEQQPDDDATVADEEGSEPAAVQPGEGEAGESENEGEAPEASSRDGPAGEDEGGDPPLEDQGLLQAEITQDADEDGAESVASGTRAARASATVTFYGNARSANPSVIARKLVSGEPGKTVPVDVSDVEAPAPTASQAFEGWEFQGRIVRDSVDVDPGWGSVELYPSFAEGHWLRFSTGAAAGQAVEVSSQFVSALQPVPETLPVSAREGYSFNGWFMSSDESARQVTAADGSVLDSQALKELLLRDDVELFASWTGQPTTYRIVFWHENPDDTGFSYEGFELVGDEDGERAVSGEMTEAADLPEAAGFTISSVERKEIAGDGTTVVNVRYERNEYSVVFHQGRTDQSPLFADLTITAKYGADIHDAWPKASEGDGAYSSTWYTLPDESSNVFVTGISTMPLGGARFYLKNDSGGNYNTVYRVQAVDGSNTFSDYVSEPFTTDLSPITTADDYMSINGFMVNAASEGDAQSIRENPSGDSAAVHDSSYETSAAVGARYDDAPESTEEGDVARKTLFLYYLRCQYDIVFMENGGPLVPDARGIYFEAPLEGSEPLDYVVGETSYTTSAGTTYEFAGWFENEQLVGDPFDFGAHRMPAGNIALYAKWVPERHLVQLDPAGGAFDDAGQSTFFMVGHGDAVGYRGVSRDYVADEAGEYVYDYAPFAVDVDGTGHARYVLAEPGDEGKRYRLSPGVYTLYGWFELADGELSTVPFDFGAPITQDTAVVARWKSEGVFDIVYNPVMQIEGGTVSGTIDSRLDDGYADLAPTFVMNTPTGIEADDGSEWRFLGWRVVESYDSDVALDDALYQEGDRFVVDSSIARGNVIYFKAVYEPVTDEGGETPSTPPNLEPQGDGTAGGEADSESEPQSGDSDDSSNASNDAQRAFDEALLPKTGDEMLMLAVGAVGVMLIAAGVALIAYVMRRRNEDLRSL